MRKLTKIVAGAIMASAGTAAMVVPASANAATTSHASPSHSAFKLITLNPNQILPPPYDPCPSKYVCLYDGAGNLKYEWEAYGCHDIYGAYGTWEIYNHQTGGALARTYGEWGCGDYIATYQPGKEYTFNATPVYSVYLSES